MYRSGFYFLYAHPPNRAAARFGLRDVFIFLMGIFCVIQILFFVCPCSKLNFCSIWIKGYVPLFDGYFYMAIFLFGKNAGGGK